VFLYSRVLRVQIKEGLRFDHCHLIRERVKGVDMDFVAAGLKINVAERLEAPCRKFREGDKHSPISRKPMQVQMTLPVEIDAHFLNLEIGHIAQSPAEGAFMGSLAAELKPFNKAAPGQQLAAGADEFRQAHVAGKDAHNVRASRRPDQQFILFGFEMPATVDVEQLRMQRPLIEGKSQLADCNIGSWRLHSSPVRSKQDFLYAFDYSRKTHNKSRPLSILITRLDFLIGRKFRKYAKTKD